MIYEDTTQTILDIVNKAICLEDRHRSNSLMLSELDKEQDDILHILEAVPLTMYESYLFCNEIRMIRNHRRKVKAALHEYKIWKDNKKHFVNAPQNIIGTFTKALTNKERNAPTQQYFIEMKRTKIAQYKGE